MTNLQQKSENRRCRICDFCGSAKLISRATAMGLTIGAVVEVVQNRKFYPVLVVVRDTMIALSRKEASRIMVEEM